MIKQKRGRGRPRMSPEARKRNNVVFRTRDQIKQQLEIAAKNNQRSLSEEIEYRLEKSVEHERLAADLLSGAAAGKTVVGLVLAIAQAMGLLPNDCGNRRKETAGWGEDRGLNG